MTAGRDIAISRTDSDVAGNRVFAWRVKEWGLSSTKRLGHRLTGAKPEGEACRKLLERNRQAALQGRPSVCVWAAENAVKLDTHDGSREQRVSDRKVNGISVMLAVFFASNFEPNSALSLPPEHQTEVYYVRTTSWLLVALAGQWITTSASRQTNVSDRVTARFYMGRQR